MYAIVATGGKQYKVAEGDVIDVEKLDAQPGDKVELPVLLLNDGDKTIVGSAPLQDKKVTGSRARRSSSSSSRSASAITAPTATVRT